MNKVILKILIITCIWMLAGKGSSAAQIVDNSNTSISDTLIFDTTITTPVLKKDTITAQDITSSQRKQFEKTLVARYIDSLAVAKQKVFDENNKKSESLNPFLYKIFGPATYYKDVTKSHLGLNEEINETIAERDNMLMKWYMTFPTNFKFYDEQFDSEEIIIDTKEKAPAKEDIKEIIEKVDRKENISVMPENMDIGLQIVKPNFWKKSGSFGLKFTQNYISDNWYKGGNNNGTMLASLYLEAKYDDTKKMSWENHLDMKLGFVTSSSDTCHTYITDNDRLNFYSKIGIKRTKSWNYTASLDLTTQFMPGYKSNDTKTYSDFLAPLNGTLSIGMDFKPSLKKGNTLSLSLLPLSYKIRYIGLEDDNIYRVLNQWSDFKQDWGSKIEFNTKFTLVTNLTWKCRFYCFTSYTYVESEMENVFQYSFSKYISGELYTLWRFDDNRKEDFYDDKLGFFQFKEYLTFGLSYSF